MVGEPIPGRWDRETERRHAALELALRWAMGTTKTPAEITAAATVFLGFMKNRGITPEDDPK